MPNFLLPAPIPAETRIAIVVAEWNKNITQKLLDGAVATLAERGIDDANIDVAWVPGSWEIPLVAMRMIETGSYSAVLCLGAVIRGETTHDEHINRGVSMAMMDIALEFDMPVLFGVLTCNTLEQAIHRAGGNVGNKGVECAEAALQMIGLLATLDAS
ncbi:6,7-dimethyl-8-ribityllumazine synthase [Aeoliella sp. SH292]|uniref:6,7-dimethyl-8-ribityllumazine synthase n=1 Tax=Aeoliella sp. SH292 TaxID=3454464 RepID=UPI003F9E6649